MFPHCNEQTMRLETATHSLLLERNARRKLTRHQTNSGKLSHEANTIYLIGTKLFIASLGCQLE